MTRQWANRWLNVGHDLRNNIDNTLPQTYQYRENAAYPTGATKSARESINDNWERDWLEFVTRNNFQDTIKKQIITDILLELLEEMNNKKKVFAGIPGHTLMEYIMVRYGKTTKPIKEQ